MKSIAFFKSTKFLVRRLIMGNSNMAQKSNTIFVSENAPARTEVNDIGRAAFAKKGSVETNHTDFDCCWFSDSYGCCIIHFMDDE